MKSDFIQTLGSYLHGLYPISQKVSEMCAHQSEPLDFNPKEYGETIVYKSYFYWIILGDWFIGSRKDTRTKDFSGSCKQII